MKNIPQNVYPDHVLIVAMHVFQNFNRASDAIAMQEDADCPALVSSDKIPASGDGAWACYKMIKLMKEKHLTPETACLWSDGHWVGLVGPGTGNFENRLGEGLKAAREARSSFMKMAEKWDWS